MDVPHAHPEWPAVSAAAEALTTRFGAAPPLAVVLGSGLGEVEARVVEAATCAPEEVGLPAPRVVGHAGRVRVGRLGATRVVVLSGRVHGYEGHAPAVVVRAVRALATWGVGTLVLTNAAGSLRPELVPGTVTRIVDHLDLTRSSPLEGPAFGERFPDASRTWTPAAGSVLDGLEPLPRVVYAGLSGPAYETAAEVRMLRALGADVVGMSTVHEALAARACGLDVVGLSIVSNHGAGVTAEPIDHEAVTRVAGEAASRVAGLLERAAPGLVQARLSG